MKVLITGHKGFVGRHFVKYFKERGDQVVGVDIKDGLDCRDFFKSCYERFDLVIHLAAIVGGREMIENEPLAVATDLSIYSEMFNWAVRTGQPKVVYYSSSAAYPIKYQKENSEIKMKEDFIDLENISNPDFTYGWSKLTGELLAEFAKKQGVSVYVFRPFSGFGEDQDLTYPIPSFINRVINRVEEFEIWGDGTQVRDFIYIDDIVNATMKAVELDIQEPINLGSGIPVSFNEVATKLFEISGWSPPNGVKHLTHKPVGVMYRCGECSKMNEFYQLEYDLDKALERILRMNNWRI
jgi:nucleoside-diphosphate-sugar epimerase